MHIKGFDKTPSRPLLPHAKTNIRITKQHKDYTFDDEVKDKIIIYEKIFYENFKKLMLVKFYKKKYGFFL